MGNMKELLDKSIQKAAKGREIWMQIVKRYALGQDDYVILMPSNNKLYNYYGLLYLDQFVIQKKAGKIVILTHDLNVLNSVELFSKKIKAAEMFSRRDAERLMKLYCLYMFTENLIIMSLDEPTGRSGIQLVGKKGLTVEELIAVGVYGLKKFEKQMKPVYTGSNEEIISFLSCEKQ